MKRVLLDTEALIWWDDNDARLGGNARAIIQDAVEVYVSAASAWEIVIKVALGKLRTTRGPETRSWKAASVSCRSRSSTSKASASFPPTTTIPSTA